MSKPTKRMHCTCAVFKTHLLHLENQSSEQSIWEEQCLKFQAQRNGIRTKMKTSLTLFFIFLRALAPIVTQITQHTTAHISEYHQGEQKTKILAVDYSSCTGPL